MTRDCESSTSAGLGLCPFGLNYWRVSNDLLIYGVSVRNYKGATPAYRKMLRLAGPQAIRLQDLEAVVARCADATDHLERRLRSQQRQTMVRYRRSRRYQREIVEQIRPELQRTFGQVHDYKQFVQQVIQNLDVHLDRRFPGLPMEEKVGRASHEETAIYWAARLMDEKLDASVLVLDPSQIRNSANQRTFRLHGLVTKYLRIYQRRMDEKGLRLHEIGGSFADVHGNPRAMGIIPHALIDNAVKYAPPGSDLTLTYAMTADTVIFKIQSLGPRIADDERDRIFDFYYRGEAAQRVDSGGTGFGLAAAQLVAREMDTHIEVGQSTDTTAYGSFTTTFSVSLPLAETRVASTEDAARRGSRRSRRV